MIGQSSEKIVAIKKVQVAGGAIPEIKVGQKPPFRTTSHARADVSKY